MAVKSLSIVVPNKSCVNKCKFCVAHMIEENYKNLIGPALDGQILVGSEIDAYDDYKTRMEYARDLGINTLVFTGNSEPQQNINFIKKVLRINKELSKPFRKIEIQTTGVLLNKDELDALKFNGLTTISLSLSAFGETNFDYNGTPEKLWFNIPKFCQTIKDLNLNLRLSINLTDFFNKWTVNELFNYCKEALLADQVTLRKFYTSGMNTIQDQWINKHSIDSNLLARLKYTIKENYGLINEMGVVMDENCMGEKLILRPNCKLYSCWDNKGSLIF